MSMAGILGDHKGSVAREVLLTMDDWTRMQEMEAADVEDESDNDVVIETTGEGCGMRDLG